jgi:hypothetical protein
VRPRRIVAVLQSGGVIVGDPEKGMIVRRTPLAFTTRFAAWARTPGGVAALMDGPPLRLVAVGRSGLVRSASLRRIRPAVSGYPGLVVDPRGRRVLVFAASAPVAEVSLRTMRVRYHRVLLPRPRGTPRPRAATTSRGGLWLWNGLAAVFGEDSSAPAGVHVVDTKTWTARTVDPGAGSAQLAAGRLLVYTSDRFVRRAAGVGLRVYARDGRRLVSHLLGRQALEVEVAGSRAYAYPAVGRSRALHVVQARSGAIVRTTAPPPRGYDLQILGGP